MDNGLPCVHCGLCLDTCPTYRVLGTETDSPRGRIYLMNAVKDGSLALDATTAGHLDSCLGCLACETACPSGVSYGKRIEEFRPLIRNKVPRKRTRSLLRWTAGNTLLMRLATTVAQIADRLGLGSVRRRLPGLDMIPAHVDGAPDPETPMLLRSAVGPPAEPRLRVGLLAGCIADRMKPSITAAAIEVLHRNGIEVVAVDGLDCCGALAMHSGDEDEAKRLATENVERFRAAGVDRIVSTAAGCGAMFAEYGDLLEGNEDAKLFSASARDVTELLAELGFEKPEAPRGETVAYHDACHLMHARAITGAPRAVVAAACGSEPQDLGENHLCCGSAGSYNLEHRAMGLTLGDRKGELMAESGAKTVAVGNIGCLLQLERAAARKGLRIALKHPVELLADAYRGRSGSR